MGTYAGKNSDLTVISCHCPREPGIPARMSLADTALLLRLSSAVREGSCICVTRDRKILNMFFCMFCLFLLSVCFIFTLLTHKASCSQKSISADCTAFGEICEFCL